MTLSQANEITQKPTYDQLLQRIHELENANPKCRKTLSSAKESVHAELDQLTQELIEAQRLAHIGNWFWLAETDVTTGSDELLRIYGFDPATQTIPNFKEQRGRCYPEEDWERINDNAMRTLKTGHGFELDVRAFRNSETIHVTMRGEIVRDSSGQIMGLRGTVQDITERKKVEETIKESERKYRELFNASSDAVLCINRDTGHILDANKRAEAMFGYSREELLTKKNWELSAEPDETRRISQTKRASKDIVNIPLRYLIRKDGDVFPAELTGRSFYWQDRSVFIAAFREITERKKAEDALRESEEKYRALIEQATEGIVLIDTETLRFTDFNDAASSGLGYSREEFADLTLYDVQGSLTKEEFIKRFRAVVEAGGGKFENKQRKKDGTIRDIIISNRVINLQGRRYVSGIWQDVTEHNQAMVAIRESRSKLETALASMTDGVFISDCDGRIIELNEAFALFCRFRNKEECIRQLTDYPMLFEVFRSNGEIAPLEMWAVPRALRGETATNEEYIIRRQDTGETWIGSYNFSPIRDETGTIVGSVTTARDITELKRNEETRRNLEATVRKKLEIILDPEGDLGELELADIIDAPALQTMIEHIYRIMKISGGVAILDIHGKVLVAVGWQDICTKFHRINPSTQKNCLESDTVLSRGISVGVSKAYRCKNNMWDIATPIIIGGRHLGNVFVGQFFYDDEEIDYDLFKRQARRYGFNENEYIAALDRVPRWSRELVEATMSFYGSLAKMIASLSYSTIKLGRTLSQKDHALSQLNESRALQESLLETIPIPVFYMDLEGRYWGVNKAFETFYGQPKEYLVGKTVFELFSVDLAKSYYEQDVKLFERPTSLVNESTMPDSHGVIHDVIFHKASLVDSQGAVIGLIGAIIDVTDRNRTAQKNKNLQEQLIQSQKMEAIGTLAGGIAHDFNNILGVILGFAELTYEDSLSGMVKPNELANILEAGNRAKDLVKQILTFSRKQSDAEKMLVSPVPLIEESIKLLRSTIPKTIEIQKDIDPNASYVYADPTQIHQVLMNLCTNAFHAMEDSGGIMKISVRECTLNQSDLHQYPNVQPGDFVQLTVSDNGPGIAPEIVNKIFEPYFTTKEIGKGTGLGLAIVHGIANDSGGFIAYQSMPGEGTIFQVYFPAVEPKPCEAVTPQKLNVSGSSRILLVDDEMMIVKMQKSMLERLGYHATICTSSLNALELFLKDPYQFDAVITDQTMPSLTGINLARQMLKIRPDLPVILCTGFSSQIDEEQARASGVKGFAMKPVPNNELAQMLRQVLDGTS